MPTWVPSAGGRCGWPGSAWSGRRLLLSYFGQGALVLTDAAAAHKPLFALVPVPLLPWMVLLATLAAIIASQATITGAFSVTRQAVQLDLLPRLRILQTSAHEHGQVFVPIVNVLVFLAVCVFVIGFGSSDALGGTYGAAVACTMTIDTVLIMVLAATRWQWSLRAGRRDLRRAAAGRRGVQRGQSRPSLPRAPGCRCCSPRCCSWCS